MMRILMVADVPPNPNSGASGTEYQTVAALRRLGHDVDTVWADDLSHRIKHGNLHSLIEQPLAYRSTVLAKMKAHDFDVVHANQPHGYLAARALARVPRAPVFVHRSHGLESRVREVLRPWRRSFPSAVSHPRRAASTVMASLLEYSNRAIARYADGHIVSSSLCSEFLERQYGVPKEAVATIAQAPPEFFRVTPVIGLDRRRISRLLYVGQFAFVKAPHVLVAAFEEILKQFPDSTLTWVCDAKHHPQAASLLNPIAREKVSFKGWMAQGDLLNIYDDHGVFLFPSLFEGFGKAFIEAMARGLVVICSAEGGAVDIIVNGVNGMLVPTGSPASIAAAYGKAMRDPAFSMALGSEARKTALLYTWDRAAEETLEFYRRLIDRKCRE